MPTKGKREETPPPLFQPSYTPIYLPHSGRWQVTPPPPAPTLIYLPTHLYPRPSILRHLALAAIVAAAIVGSVLFTASRQRKSAAGNLVGSQMAVADITLPTETEADLTSHPDYLALVNGEASLTAKACIAGPAACDGFLDCTSPPSN